ncbi:EAL domain-containing protein [Salinisphaera orenii]|uniref:Diguanylate cyclase n=1 Tax=Salinisphaera orenii YIM 95161 TaxID=1051139 RepID=A0A423PSV3_9GAMM|nr:sensor domain-containing phosphodiesterase [Salinisphaera halophila]ROO28658.1 hypothetical protein SAHL_09860 [Salinisphaera halophila YIM 95161]
MNQAQASVAAPSEATPETLKAVVIGREQDAIEAVRAALSAQPHDCELIHASDPANVVSPEQVGAIALYGLVCPAETDSARRALALLRNLADDAPILLFVTAEAGLDALQAVAEGAWDLCPLDDASTLNRRVAQAMEIGHSRLARHDLGQRLVHAQRRLDVLLSQGEDARASLIDGRIVDASPAFARLLGLADVADANGLDLLDAVAEHERGRVEEAIAQVAREHTDTSMVFDLATREGRRQPVRALFQPGVDEPGGRQRVSAVFQASDQGRAPIANAPQRPLHDGRMALHKVLAHTDARSPERVPGLIFVATDEISTLQDRMGLAQSDLVLQELGLFLLENLRGEDRVFRFGAGEYVLLVERHSSREIAESAERLHQMLSEEIFGDERHSATLSASVAHIPLVAGGVHGADQRLRMVMDAAYDLRAEGGNACRACESPEPEHADPEADAQQWVPRLQQALARDRFSLAYQSITSLAGDSQPYFDCLLRYVDDRGALVRPGEFLGAAEQAGLMPEIDRWVARRAIAVIDQQRAKDAHITLFVKLSAATLSNADAFVAALREAVRERAIPRHQLILSLREDDVRAQTHAARALARTLDEDGFRVALTHYGSTPKAIQVLDNLPAAFIKLAPDFARQVLGGNEDGQLGAIIANARERQIPLIAEQIEDANSMARLWQAGVNYVQGHFIQEPDTEALAHTENRLR